MALPRPPLQRMHARHRIRIIHRANYLAFLGARAVFNPLHREIPVKRRLLFLTLVLLLCPLPARPQAAPAEDMLEVARQHILAADYNTAIELLSSQLESLKPDPERLRKTYLLLILSKVQNSVSHRNKGETATAKSIMNDAKGTVLECLRNEQLRHTQPVLENMETPPLMAELFEDVRREIFGGFQIQSLEPPGAMAILDGDTLWTLPGSDFIGDTNLSLGPHIVVVQAEGYQTTTENITIAAGVTVEKNYALKKKKGTFWYISRGGIMAALVVAGGVLGIGGGSDPLQPLPGPPAPP